jgi:hypothetical protein
VSTGINHKLFPSSLTASRVKFLFGLDWRYPHETQMRLTISTPVWESGQRFLPGSSSDALEQDWRGTARTVAPFMPQSAPIETTTLAEAVRPEYRL